MTDNQIKAGYALQPVFQLFPAFTSLRSMAWLGLGVMFSTLISQPSWAEENAPVKRGGFQLSAQPVYEHDTIYITTSKDGSNNAIVPSDIKFGLRGKLDFKRRSGYAEQAGLFAGHCKRTDCGVNSLLWYRSTDTFAGSPDNAVRLPANDWSIGSIITTSPDRLLMPTEKISLINRCKQSPSSTFNHEVTVTLSVNTRKNVQIGSGFIGAYVQSELGDIAYNGGDQSRHTSFNLQVQCQSITHQTSPKKPVNQGLGFDHGSMKVKDIKLTFTTFQNGYTEPNPGTRCKKARLRVRMETNQKGLVSFKLFQNRGGQSTPNKDYIIGSHHDGNGRFFAQKDFEIRVYKTTNVMANARELISETFKKETGWKDILLTCRGAGGSGGLATPTDDGEDRNTPKPSLQGGFQLLDNSAKAKHNQCSRKAKALVWFTNSNAKNIHYSLDCGALGNFSGTLQPRQIGDGKYRAAQIIPFTVENTIQAGCTLRSVSPGSPRDHARLSRTFTCHKTTGHGQGGGFQSPRRPTHGASGETIGKRARQPVKVDVAKRCKTNWKVKCSRKPTVECRNKTTVSCKPTVKKQCKKIKGVKCKKVTKKTCTNKPVMNCSKQPVRICKKVRGKLICKTHFKKKCKRKVKRICTTKTVRQCTPTVKVKCSNKVTKECRKKTVKQCKTKMKKFCERKKEIICRR